MTLYDFIVKNKSTIEECYREGVVNSSSMFHFKLAKEFKELDPKMSKMVRYQWVADENNVSVNTVRDAIKKMGV